MNKKVINEINQMKFLFGYKPGKVISEQDLPESNLDEMEKEDVNVEETNEDFDVMDFEDIEMSPEVAPAPTREREKTREKEREDKPFRPRKPNREDLPYENPETRPQGEYEDDFSIDDLIMKRGYGSKKDSEMDETIYEIEIDTDIEDLFKKK